MTNDPFYDYHASIQADIVALQERLTKFRSSLKDKPTMKYSLESLPDLLGEQEFTDLCIALGLYPIEETSGVHVARHIRGAVLRRERMEKAMRDNIPEYLK